MAKSKENNKSSKTATGGQKSKDIVFDIQAIHDVLVENCQGEVNPAASVYLAGALQSVTAEIIEIIATEKKDEADGASAITKEELQKAVEQDEELSRLFHT